MKYIFIFFFSFSTLAVCQPGKYLQRNEPFANLQLNPTTLILPGEDSELSFSYLYKVPYNRLIFERAGKSYHSSVRILVEIYNDDELVTREFVERQILVDDFEGAESKSASLQGAIHFNLANKQYTVKGSYTDLNSGKELPFHTINLDGEKISEIGIFDPIIIDPSETGCSSNSLPMIINQGNEMPFSPNTYSLIIPFADTTVKSVQIEITNNEENPITRTIDKYMRGKIDVTECDGKIYLSSNSRGIKTNNFIVNDINFNLKEGLYNLKIKANENDETEFPLFVRWINKPISLRNPEFAIEILKYIEADSVLTEMLDFDEEDYPKLLISYWKKFDPTPDTEFNELMEEFYSRIDFAAMEFRGIGKKNGVSTDRGRVYIQNGKPDDIERTSNELGNVIEIWIYKKINKVFQFVDKQGTGNFILVES